MKRLQIRYDDDDYEDLRILASRKNASISALARYAIDKTFEDDLDIIAGERGLAEHLADPSSSIPLDEYLLEIGLKL